MSLVFGKLNIIQGVKRSPKGKQARAWNIAFQKKNYRYDDYVQMNQAG